MMKNILIVDDESRLLQSLQAGLLIYRNRFKVFTAANGKEAVRILDATPIDLVVTDLKMPEMDGFELLAHIHAKFPSLPAIVMTAFSTPDIEEKLVNGNNLRLLEKPVDFDELANAISEALERDVKEGSLTGISLANFLQLLEMEQKTCLLEVTSKEGQGYIYFNQGELYAAISGKEKGEEAVYKMLLMEDVHIMFKKQPLKQIKKLISKPLFSLLMEGLKRKDEMTSPGEQEPPLPEHIDATLESSDALQEGARSLEAPADETPAAGNLPSVMNNPLIGDEKMAKIEETLGRLKDVEGFMAVGIFTSNGEMAAQVNNSGIKIAEIGSLANDVLLKAQKATGMMDVGRGQTVHIEAPKAHIIAQCYNENADFSVTEAGKAHIHLVLLLAKDGNLAMAKMKLGSVIQEAAAAFR
jgi:CheY-like chemotaxis protein/predicted regulator of Ras-like GTPase activity (Roadblock/LC7/MglB family)